MLVSWEKEKSLLLAITGGLVTFVALFAHSFCCFAVPFLFTCTFGVIAYQQFKSDRRQAQMLATTTKTPFTTKPSSASTVAHITAAASSSFSSLPPRTSKASSWLGVPPPLD